VQGHFVFDAGARFLLGEISHVLVGQRGRWGVLLFGDRALEAAHDVGLDAIELRAGETELLDPKRLCEQRVESAFDPVLFHTRVQRRDFERPDELTASGAGAKKRRDVFISIEGIRGGSFNDTLFGDGSSNVLRGNLGADLLSGGSEPFALDFFDFADYIEATGGVRVDLGNPANNTGEAAGDSFSAIEGLGGSNFNDTLVGNAFINFLRGQGGADVLNGAGGSVDYADYINAPSAIRVNLGNPAANTGEAVGDSYIAIAGLLGSNFNDTLIGDAGDNFLLGWLGADVLDGGPGTDFADYRVGTPVFVDLSAPGNNTGNAAGDTFISIEGVAGSTGDDTLIGNGGDNVLRGQSGGDVLNGAAGFDTASYRDAFAAVVVNLENPAANTGQAEGDTFISIEAISGSGWNDTLTGDDGDNLLIGNNGNDVLAGGGGIDTLDGGLGNDTYFLKPGDQWRDAGGVDTVFSPGGFSVLPANLEHVALLQRAGNVSVTGSDAGNRFIGNGGTNLLDGGAGNDTLEGGRGDDTLIGGAGRDRLDGGRGADVMEGGAGNDVYVVGSARDQVVELAASGLDTVEVMAPRYAVAANIENVFVLYSGGSFVTGNDLSNIIAGGAGNDTLAGGDGRDAFLFSETDNVDLLLDFTPGVDRIAVDEGVFGTDIVYDASSGALFYDGVVQFAQLGAPGALHPALTEADIQFV
jgi:Ca2+-binding RTX toxin-like protein